jgi:hypothetical protein
MNDLDEIRDLFVRATAETAERPAEAVKAACLMRHEIRVLRQRVADLEAQVDTAVRMIVGDDERLT